MARFSTKHITTVEELHAMGSEWDLLLSSAQSPSVFLTWEWVTSWLATVHPKADLFVIVVRLQGSLIAIAPFYRTEFTLFSCITYKTIRLIGDCHSGAEYPDVIISSGFEGVALQQIANYIQDSENSWDCAWFPNIASWSKSRQRLTACFDQSELSFCRTSEMDFSRIVLPRTWEDYLNNFSPKRRALLRRQERAAVKTHQLQFHLCEHKRDVTFFLEQLFALHRERWNMVGEEGAFVRRPLMEHFYRKIAPLVIEKGWLAFFLLTVNGEVKAVQYGYVYNGVFSQLQEGFSSQSPSGIGNILRQYVIRWCIEKGFKEYDFLGGHSPHKEQWQAEKRLGQNLFLGKKSFKNSIFSQLPIWPSGRYVNQGIPETPSRSLG